MSSRWRKSTTLVATAALVAGSAVASGALTGVASADPAGTITLASGVSSAAKYVTLLAADSDAVVYALSDDTESTTYLKPTGEDPITIFDGCGDVHGDSLVGDLLTCNSGNSVTYQSVDGSLNGSVALTNDQDFLTGTADGFVYTEVSPGDGLPHLYDYGIPAGSVTDLGAVPTDPYYGTAPSDIGNASASSDGLVFGYLSNPGEYEIYYLPFANPSEVVNLENYSSAAALSDLTLAVGSAAWIENDGATQVVVRAKLDGSSRVEAPLPSSDGRTLGIALTTNFTGVITTPNYILGNFETVPAAGGSFTTYANPVVVGNVASDGTNFIVDQSGDPSSAGLYSMPSAAGPATQILSAGPAALVARSIATSPGRVAWSDNQDASSAGLTAWNRDLTISGSTITAGDPTLVAQNATMYGISTSGRRVAYVVPTQVGPQTAVTDGSTSVTLGLGWSGVLSGMRVLTGSPWVNDWAIYDLAKNDTRTSLPDSGNAFTYALWGDELVWLATDGSVSFEDLSTGSTVQVVGGTATSGDLVSGGVTVAGDDVAWSERICSSDGSVCTQSTGYRNAHTLDAAKILNTADRGAEIALSNNYLAVSYQGPDYDEPTLVTYDLADDSATTIDTLDNYGPNEIERQFALSGNTLAWIGSDFLPHAVELQQQPDVPWYLGDGVAPSSLIADGSHDWNGEFVASAALADCTLTISSGGDTVRSLPCDDTYLSEGDALVSWDGKDAEGSLVQPGTYTWTLSGANADGNLLNADGSTTPITGVIHVSASAPSGGGGGGAPTSAPSGVNRLSGPDRIGTAAAVSKQEFPNGGAGAVVLARADDYPDALVGGPLAVAKNAPLLLAQGSGLPAATKAELQRVLPAGGTVYLLGSTAAIPGSVDDQLTSLGYHVVRYGGANRYATAVAVADALGDPTTVLLATGTNFPDALSAGPAASKAGGVVLLTAGNQLPPETSAYLAAHTGAVYAVGGPAVSADAKATPIVGPDRYATAVAVAQKFFSGPATIGIATGTNFPDALAGGAMVAAAGGPLLLSDPSVLAPVTGSYLASVQSTVTGAYLFGAANALADSVGAAVGTALGQ